MEELQNALWSFVKGFMSFAVVLIIGALVIKIALIPVKKLLLKSKIDLTAKTFLYSIIRVVFYGIVVITALGTAKVDITSLVTALGAAALTAGLAFQDTLKNFVSGMIVLFNKPIAAGDLIRIEDIEGYVDNIKIFYTQIHTFDNRIVAIPNSKLTTNNVINCSSAGTRRIDVKFSVSYEDNLSKVKSVVYDVIADIPQVIGEPEPKVYVSKHLDSGVEIFAMIWVKQEDYYPVKFRLIEDVKNAFDENSITIPYPHVMLANKTEK